MSRRRDEFEWRIKRANPTTTMQPSPPAPKKNAPATKQGGNNAVQAPPDTDVPAVNEVPAANLVQAPQDMDIPAASLPPSAADIREEGGE